MRIYVLGELPLLAKDIFTSGGVSLLCMCNTKAFCFHKTGLIKKVMSSSESLKKIIEIKN